MAVVHPHSLTYSAVRPLPGEQMVIYPGPFAAVVTEDGRTVERGVATDLPWTGDAAPGATAAATAERLPTASHYTSTRTSIAGRRSSR